MSAISGRLPAAFLLRGSALRRLSTLAAFLLLTHFLAAPALAVVVRGVVTDPLGHPVRGARIQIGRASCRERV